MSDSALSRAEQAIELAARDSSKTLDLHGLGLKVLPAITVDLRAVRRIDLSGNRLKDLPPEIFKLEHLESLDLGGNRFTELDSAISSVRALRFLDLSENRLAALPDELAALKSIEHLILFQNQFSVFPSAILELSSLQSLDLALNRLDVLPDLRSLTKLQVLDLAGNRLTALPPGLASLSELGVLDLSQNRLTNVDALAFPGALQEIDLDDNLLKAIPSLPRPLVRLFARGNPISAASDKAYPAGPGSPTVALRDLVSGGYEEGKRNFEAPEHQFGFSLNLQGVQAVTGSLGLYFKAFPDTPISMRLTNGSQVDLARVGRKAALDLAGSSDSVMLEFPPTSNATTVKVNCEFAERVLERVPGAALIETGTPSFRGGGPVPENAPPPTVCAVSPPATVPTAAPGASDPVTNSGEPVDSAVFCPSHVPRDSVFLIQVFLYPPAAAAQVDAQARQVDENAQRRATYSLPFNLPLGTRVDLHLEIPGLTVSEPDAVLVWRGGPTAAQFEATVPSDCPAPQVIGRVRIAVAGVPAGTLRFQVVLTAAGTPPGAVDSREVQAKRFRRAFVSYSSKDRPEVLRRVQAFKIAGLSVFQDILDLDPGDRWEKKLYQEIDNCDVFLLFWSHAAADSPWVGKEIDYALVRKQGNDELPPDIQPVPIEGPPITPPPPSLSGIHFNDALLAQIRAADTVAAPPSVATA